MDRLEERDGAKKQDEEIGVGGSGATDVEGRSGRDEVFEKVLGRRERHRERSVFVRGAVVVAGGAVSLLAAPLSVVAPELGLPLLLFGLRLLALEFDWAARLYARVARFAKKVAGKFGALWRGSGGKVALVVAFLAVVLVAVFVVLG